MKSRYVLRKERSVSITTHVKKMRKRMFFRNDRGSSQSTIHRPRKTFVQSRGLLSLRTFKNWTTHRLSWKKVRFVYNPCRGKQIVIDISSKNMFCWICTIIKWLQPEAELIDLQYKMKIKIMREKRGDRAKGQQATTLTSLIDTSVVNTGQWPSPVANAMNKANTARNKEQIRCSLSRGE